MKHYCSFREREEMNIFEERKKVLIIVFTIIIAFVGFGRLTKETEAREETQIKIRKAIKMKVTAYCPCKKCCGKHADGKTSTNRDAYKTFGVAADPAVIPYGTVLIIPGVGERVVDDTGGAMRQSTKKGIYHIDVRFHSHQEAKNFGVQWLKVKIL